MMTPQPHDPESADPSEWPPCGLTVPEWEAVVERSTAAGLAWLPEPALERLARRYLSRSALRRRRLTERNQCLQELAISFYVTSPSGAEIAERIAAHLTQYRGAGRLNGPPPDDPRRALLHRVLRLSDGQRPLGAEAIRKVLAGLGGWENSAPQNPNDAASNTP